MGEEFTNALSANQGLFGIDLSDDAVSDLSKYYELVKAHNPLLHLVAPCSAEDFATRHILESLTLLHHFPQNAKFADVGAGAGLPSIPCLIARKDLKATLIESKVKKADFLQTAGDELKLNKRSVITNRQFEETMSGEAEFVTCRALDKFVDKLPKLIKWSKGLKLLFFGGPALRIEMEKLGLTVQEQLMPLSERRYLFISQARK